jgi:hypothetical protein
MKNFLIGACVILAFVCTFWLGIGILVYASDHLSSNAKVLIGLILFPTAAFSGFFASNIGENISNWRNG